MGFRDRQHVRRSSRLELLPAWAPTVLMVVFVIGVMGLGYFTFTKVKQFVAGSEIAVVAPPDMDADQSGEVEGAGDQEAMPAGWTEGRITVLLMGIDERQLEHGPWRTDTVILLTIDPVSQTAGMISFPRDLWVEIPNYGGVYDRINTAHFRGDADNYPGGGGPALAMETVRHNFGVPVDYFASVNFYAFIQIIDRLDCVPITVPETIDDPDYPAAEGFGYDPFHIEAGEHCMGGETLLKYARTRATFGSDFDRASRQQQVILAIRDHVLADPNTLQP
jgi:LCP family protein required for cell wall assembly